MYYGDQQQQRFYGYITLFGDYGKFSDLEIPDRDWSLREIAENDLNLLCFVAVRLQKVEKEGTRRAAISRPAMEYILLKYGSECSNVKVPKQKYKLQTMRMAKVLHVFSQSNPWFYIFFKCSTLSPVLSPDEEMERRRKFNSGRLKSQLS